MCKTVIIGYYVICYRFDSSAPISICEMRVFYQKYFAPHRCGSPDTPLHSTIDYVMYGSKYGVMPYYRFKCDTNFELIGSEEVRCGLSNYWLDEFPACEPTIICPIEDNMDLATVVANFANFWATNRSLVAIPGSQMVFDCDHLENRSKVMIGDSVRVCTESGKWTGIQPYCMG